MSAQKYKTGGTVHEILPEESRGDYKSQSLVLEVDGYKTPQYVVMEFFGKNIAQMVSAQVGDSVEIEWEFQGKQSQSNGKYYSKCSAWKLTRTAEGRTQSQRTSTPDRNFSRPPERGNDRLRNPQPAGRDENEDPDF